MVNLRMPRMDTESSDALDRQDMARLCGGHDTALNDLMSRHAQRLFHYLIRQLQDESEAEDVAQEAFVRVYQHRQKYDAKYRFSTWLYTIAQPCPQPSTLAHPASARFFGSGERDHGYRI